MVMCDISTIYNFQNTFAFPNVTECNNFVQNQKYIHIILNFWTLQFYYM